MKLFFFLTRRIFVNFRFSFGFSGKIKLFTQTTFLVMQHSLLLTLVLGTFITASSQAPPPPHTKSSNHLSKPSTPPSDPSSSDDPVADPAFPPVNVQYGKFGRDNTDSNGFAYPACVDTITLNTTSTPNSIATCGDLHKCTVYCFDDDNRYQSTFQCSGGGSNMFLVMVMTAWFFGMLCGGGGVFFYYKRKFGTPYSGYIEINA